MINRIGETVDPNSDPTPHQRHNNSFIRSIMDPLISRGENWIYFLDTKCLTLNTQRLIMDTRGSDKQGIPGELKG